jgi:hypothetical protein
LRGYKKGGIPDAVRAAGGEIYAITSEPQTLASEARAAWGLDFECVGDPHHEIVDECRARGWLDLFVNHRADSIRASGLAWASHPRGYLQPGVLAVSRHGRVLYRWRSRPTRRNTGGATGRVLHDHVWSAVRDALRESADAPDVRFDHPPLDLISPPWPVFVFLLLANGNFVRPQPFPLRRGSDDKPMKRRVRGAMLKIVCFLAAWGAAFAFLPTLPVALALGVFCAAVTPGIVGVHRAFQNVPGAD